MVITLNGGQRVVLEHSASTDGTGSHTVTQMHYYTFFNTIETLPAFHFVSEDNF